MPATSRVTSNVRRPVAASSASPPSFLRGSFASLHPLQHRHQKEKENPAPLSAALALPEHACCCHWQLTRGRHLPSLSSPPLSFTRGEQEEVAKPKTITHGKQTKAGAQETPPLPPSPSLLLTRALPPRSCQLPPEVAIQEVDPLLCRLCNWRPGGEVAEHVRERPAQLEGEVKGTGGGQAWRYGNSMTHDKTKS